MLMLSLNHELGIMPALLMLTAQSAGAAIADVTVDALVAQNSITHPPLAADMQSLCGFSSSVGALLGFSLSGLLVHSMGSQVCHFWLMSAFWFLIQSRICNVITNLLVYYEFPSGIIFNLLTTKLQLSLWYNIYILSMLFRGLLVC